MGQFSPVNMAAFGFGSRMSLFGTGWGISISFHKWIRIESSGQVRSPFLAKKLTFQFAHQGGHWPRAVTTERLLINQWVWLQS